MAREISACRPGLLKLCDRGVVEPLMGGELQLEPAEMLLLRKHS